MNTLQSTAIDWAAVRSGTHDIPLELIRPTAENARKTFRWADIHERAESLRNHSQIKAGTVHPVECDANGARFELIDGEITWRAFRTIEGAMTMRCEVTEVDSVADVHRRMMVTHVNRTDLNPIERGAMWARERELSGKSIEDLAEQYGYAGRERTIYNLISLAEKLIPDAAAAVCDERISQEHGVLIARRTEAEQVRALAACFRPEATTSAAGVTEMVPTLISVKELRVWIQMNLDRQETPVKTFFDATEQKEQRETQLEKQADGMLDQVGDVDESGDMPSEPERAAESTGSERPLPVAHESSEYDAEMLRRRTTLLKIANGRIEVCDDLLRFAIRKLMGALMPLTAVKEARHALCWKGDEFQDLKGDELARALAVLLSADEVAPHATVDCLARFNIGCIRNAEEFALRQAHAANEKPAKKSKPKKFKPNEIAKLFTQASKAIFDAFEIDDSDVTSMRETGESDASLQNLIDAHLQGEEPTTLKVDGDVFVTYTNAYMELFCGDTILDKREDVDYIASIRMAGEIPQPFALDAKKKPAKKSKSKK